MRELIIRNVATKMSVRGALAKPFKAGEIRMEILQQMAETKQSHHQPMKQTPHQHTIF